MGYPQLDGRRLLELDLGCTWALRSSRSALADPLASPHRSQDVIHTHVKLNYTKIQRQLAVWAADDARIRAWDPQYNSMAGSQHMTPSPYAGATAAYLQLQAVGMQGVMGGQLAAALGDAAGIMGGAPTNGQAAPTNGQATATGARRDLVVEFEERAQVVKGWRSEAWLQDLLL